MLSVLGKLHHRPATVPSSTTFHGGSCSHRLKQLEKWNRRALSYSGYNMDACTPVGSISEDFASCIKSAYLCCKLTYLGTKQCTTCISSQENGKVVPMEDLKSFQGCLSNEENLKVEEIGTSFSDLHVEDSCDQWSYRELSLELEMCDLSRKDKKQTIAQKDTLDSNTKRGLSKSATFPCPEKVLPFPMPSNGGETISSASLQAQCSLKSDNLVYTRSNSLPLSPPPLPLQATSKLVSALKGGREREGAPPKTKLTVRWAPDVYDPPATSMSHTVNNHHYQRPKARKKDQHKHKHKSKYSRGSTREKKQHPRLQVLESSSVADVSAQSSVGVLNYMASNQESKCGSSAVLVGSLAKLHFSVAEAT
ncbi:hypothetical protein Taro_007092 [Colocasia esculenta]|uniref:Uncharacterized protein n=1 Tax=Colocasia esculenta TaxID=4460 RepID=A0A843TXZ8_COLES|nr:hypothetical protein [Colocasia esculenta]